MVRLFIDSCTSLSASRVVVETDAIDHLGGSLAALGDIDQRKRVCPQPAECLDRLGRLQAGPDRIFIFLLA